ncbi:MAG: hypothetical protein QOE70_1386 [Chthoniobacter sp.]|nr:hypothetical protein [Chthoniobacter sp.]
MKYLPHPLLAATLAAAFLSSNCLAEAPVAPPPAPPVAKATPAPKPPRKPEDAITAAPVNPGRQKAFLERAKDKNIQLVFLGDSITDFWLRDDGSHGKPVWDQFYAKYNAADFGVSGEHTEHTLGHIAGGILDGLNPKVVVLMIGTNNIGQTPDDKPEWAAAGVKKVVETVHQKLPNSKVLLLGVFPRDGKDSPRRHAVEGINAIIRKLDDGKKTRYLDLTPKFLDANGEIPKDVMPDGLHPNTRGYQIWAEAMQPLLTQMMK